jgi:DNA-binding NarL/FixJ family response regulator
VRRLQDRGPSPREVQVIRLVADGFSSEEVGQRMGLSSRTVEKHLTRLYVRYEVASRTQLAILGVRKGWISELPR